MATISGSHDINFTDVTKFDFYIMKLPHVSFNVDNVTLPGISVSDPNYNTPFKELKVQGDTIEYDPLSIRYKISRDYKNYTDIFDWIEAIGFPKKRAQFSDYLNKQNTQYGDLDLNGLFSDATLTTLSNKNNPQIQFIFEGLYPTSLGSITYDTTPTSIDALAIDATFSYNSMRYEVIV